MLPLVDQSDVQEPLWHVLHCKIPLVGALRQGRLSSERLACNQP